MSEIIKLKPKQTSQEINGEEKSNKMPVPLNLFDMALESSDFFHTPDKVAYAVIDRGHHHEVWPLRSHNFRMWLARQFYMATGMFPSKKDLKNALYELEMLAMLDSPEQPVFVRFAKVGDAIYIDLGNEKWEQVKITGDGWEIIPCVESEVRFIRSLGMLELPKPIRGGSLLKLRDFLNLENEEDFILTTSWLIGSMNPDGPFSILIVHGVQGSAKSTMLKLFRSCLDPSKSSSRALSKSVRDLLISASNSWVQSFDNLSSISNKMSDALCNLSTGGGYATRKLYTDGVEVILDAIRPIILGGITHFETQNDLIDRAIIIILPYIPKNKRRLEDEIKDDWKCEMPGILGALYDAVSTALNNLNEIKYENLPRMADFARFVIAAEPALPWDDGMFLKAYEDNRTKMVDAALEVDPLGAPVLEFMEKHNEWSGTHSELLEALKNTVSKSLQKVREWPKSPNSLSNRLMKLEAFFRKKGVTIERKRRADKRVVALRKIDVEEKSDSRSWGDNSPFVGPNRPDQSDGTQDNVINTQEVSPDEINSDYQSEPAAIEDLVWEEGEE